MRYLGETVSDEFKRDVIAPLYSKIKVGIVYLVMLTIIFVLGVSVLYGPQMVLNMLGYPELAEKTFNFTGKGLMVFSIATILYLSYKISQEKFSSSN